ncbi:hypothetical protein J7I80_11200 [Bacillus sp. ISL-41]|uniref:hypothetical protein n=1 Tax=Bacillus sp. ISL-41 TaxID=2819127 RepID=UPI001BE7760E|nr:hypothetical protein [Bacillus sp. ISL-41]MBT2642795.1 hypothetical protein [Bacillus sp. ISL-41]
MTVEKGMWTRQVDERQVTAQEALEIMLPLNEANQLWKINIYLIPLFVAAFIALVYSPFRPKRHFKWYVFLYFTLLMGFVVWDIAVHREITEEIAKVLNGLE